MDVLRKQIDANKAVLLRELDVNKDLLTGLSKHDVINITECVKLQQIADTAARNRAFLDTVSHSNEDLVYAKLIQCLQDSRQNTVAAYLIDVREEMQILNQIQVNLDQDMKQMNDFLATEERRAGIYLTEMPAQEDDTPALSETDVWNKVQDCLKRSKQQLDRCKGVIQKLHQDCELVAKQNADIVEHTKECDAKIKAVLSIGRHSAKQKTVPKKTQDIFANLMDDIEKLVKTRKRVLDKETEGRRHSTRIIRQCRDWIESRTLALKKLNSGQSNKSSDPPGESESTVTTQRDAPPVTDNAILSILESIQLMEKELQEYVHQELTATDKLRHELRQKHLQKKLHGFSMHGMSDIENALDNLEKHPESLKENIQVVKTCIHEISKEYGDCVSYLNKVDPHSADSDAAKTPPSNPREQKARNWPTTFKRKQNTVGTVNKNKDLHQNGLTKVEPNQLLDRIKTLTIKYEELKNDEQNLSNKFRTELSKKKRDMDLLLQRKEDQIMKLQTDIKEINAEKEKYKKLYNDTKIGYQRNYEGVATPR